MALRPTESPTARRHVVSAQHVFAAYIVCSVAALIVLRAALDALDFLDVGWIVVLVALPLLPWVLPRLGEFVRTLSPFVETLKVGAVQLDLRTVQRAPIGIAMAGLPSLPDDVSALSAGTSISDLVSKLRDLRRQGGTPTGVVDLQYGHKWRMPNIYFLARLLEIDPVVRQLIFTETRGGIDGFLVGTAPPELIRLRIEQTLPAYAEASVRRPVRDEPTLTDPAASQRVGEDFRALLDDLGPGTSDDRDPLLGYVTSARIVDVAGPLSATAIEGAGPSLDEAQVHRVVEAPYRFVPTTSNGRVTGMLDRDAVALTAARAAFARA